MKRLRKIERTLDRIAIRNLTFYIVCGQGLALLLGIAMPGALNGMYLYPNLVLNGEWWRLLSFAFCPPSGNPFLAIFALYLLYLMGGSLEHRWGTLRFNLFVFIGYAMTIGAAFVFPFGPATNLYITGSIFLAFAYNFPDFQLLLLFVLPVKVKWLAALTWLGYLWSVIFGDWQTRLIVLASVTNFLLFFGKDIALRVRYGHRQMRMEAAQVAARDKPTHICSACGVTDKSDRTMEFRYCTKCDPPRNFCMNHLRDHQHVQG